MNCSKNQKRKHVLKRRSAWKLKYLTCFKFVDTPSSGFKAAGILRILWSLFGIQSNPNPVKWPTTIAFDLSCSKPITCPLKHAIPFRFAYVCYPRLKITVYGKFMLTSGSLLLYACNTNLKPNSLYHSCIIR